MATVQKILRTNVEEFALTSSKFCKLGKGRANNIAELLANRGILFSQKKNAESERDFSRIDSGDGIHTYQGGFICDIFRQKR